MVRAFSRGHRPWIRLLVWGLAWAALLYGVVRVACLQGLIRPVRISGSSRATSFLGEHLELNCRDCGFPCQFDAVEPPRDGRVVCPNCGCVHRGWEVLGVQPGQRVLVDRLACAFRDPQRWDVVAVRLPDDDRQLAIKRVVGLPGDYVEIREGDIFVAGRIQRKSLYQLRSLAIPVHDSGYRVPGLPPRWAGESEDSNWREEAGTFIHEPSRGEQARRPGQPRPAAAPGGSGSRPHDWLTYRHWRCFSSPLPRTDEYPVLDDCGYNQNESRQLHRVTDLLLVCDLRVELGAGTLAFRADDGRDLFEVLLDPAGHTGRLCRNGETVLEIEAAAATFPQGATVELALCDHRVSLAINKHTVVEHDYTPSARAFRPTARPLAVGVCGLRVSVRRLHVLRDIYYLDPAGLGRRWTPAEPLAADAVFVLGDNAARSSDSRQDQRGGVTRQLLLGKVWRGW